MVISPPSGRQIRLSAGSYAACITEVGASLRELSFEGADIIDGYPADSMAEGCRGQILAPWPNRLRDGRWSWKGTEMLVPVDDPGRGNSASHGLVRWAPWDVLEASVDHAVLTMRLHPRPGYPFTLDFTASFRLSDGGLTAEIVAFNPSDEDVPVALGAHPYLKPLGGAPIDGSRLTIPARERVLVDVAGQPNAVEMVAGGPFDFRAPAEIGGLAINHAFTSLEYDDAGFATVTLEDDDGAVTLRTDAETRWIQVFSGDSLPEGQRREGIAIEPMTAPAGALATGTGLTILEPGDSKRLSWTISARRR